MSTRDAKPPFAQRDVSRRGHLSSSTARRRPSFDLRSSHRSRHDFSTTTPLDDTKSRISRCIHSPQASSITHHYVDSPTPGLHRPAPRLLLPHPVHRVRALLPLRARRRAYCAQREAPHAPYLRHCRIPDPTLACRRFPLHPYTSQRHLPRRIREQSTPLPDRQVHGPALPPQLRTRSPEPLVLVSAFLRHAARRVQQQQEWLQRHVQQSRAAAKLHGDRELLWDLCVAGAIRVFRELERRGERVAEHGERVRDWRAAWNEHTVQEGTQEAKYWDRESGRQQHEGVGERNGRCDGSLAEGQCSKSGMMQYEIRPSVFSGWSLLLVEHRPILLP